MSETEQDTAAVAIVSYQVIEYRHHPDGGASSSVSTSSDLAAPEAIAWIEDRRDRAAGEGLVSQLAPAAVPTEPDSPASLSESSVISAPAGDGSEIPGESP